MIGAYLDKFRCKECGNFAWSIGNPNTCPSCGGTMVLEVQGTVAVKPEDSLDAKKLECYQADIERYLRENDDQD